MIKILYTTEFQLWPKQANRALKIVNHIFYDPTYYQIKICSLQIVEVIEGKVNEWLGKSVDRCMEFSSPRRRVSAQPVTLGFDELRLFNYYQS